MNGAMKYLFQAAGCIGSITLEMAAIGAESSEEGSQWSFWQGTAVCGFSLLCMSLGYRMYEKYCENKKGIKKIITLALLGLIGLVQIGMPIYALMHGKKTGYIAYLTTVAMLFAALACSLFIQIQRVMLTQQGTPRDAGGNMSAGQQSPPGTPCSGISAASAASPKGAPPQTSSPIPTASPIAKANSMPPGLTIAIDCLNKK